MASSLFMVQQILSGLSTAINGGLKDVNSLNSTSFNGTETGSGNTTVGIPTDLLSLLTTLFSISALGDWLKLIIIGGLFETCRRIAFSAYHQFVDSFFITARFQKDDSSYDWMMVWLSKQPSWANARDLNISTRSFGLNSSAVLIPGEDADDLSSLANKGTRKLAYLPALSTSYSMIHKGRWMTVIREQSETGSIYGEKEETLAIKVMTRTHQFLNELLLEAKREYMAAQENTISIYVADSGNYWRHVASRPKRSMQSVILDHGIKDVLIEDARDFLESKSWYTDRGIPFRRGYLLYGAPGSGKTSMIHSMAGELGLDVYVVSLSRIGLDDSGLGELISQLPERCIALMEDIDAAFQGNLTKRDLPDESSQNEEQEGDSRKSKSPADGLSGRITLSGLLNCLDGLGAQEGRILYATTNHYGALDGALIRPGRLDLHVEFRLASKFQARELYRCFYVPTGTVLDAFDALDPPDSGYSSTGCKQEADLRNISVAPSSASSDLFEEKEPLLASSVFTGSSHRGKAPKLSSDQIHALAAAFSDVIPERQLSMASLQGYLMLYKTRPFEAVQDAAAWVLKEEIERKDRKGKGQANQVPPLDRGSESDGDDTASSVHAGEQDIAETTNGTREVKIILSIAAVGPASSPSPAIVTVRAHVDAATSTSEGEARETTA